uniref:PDXDC1-like third domain-containing protein n=1 Tax=Micrurus lemniscatus lemniscatus TaxID=129467 RepID=A0A2D4H7J6_MICLE
MNGMYLLGLQDGKGCPCTEERRHTNVPIFSVLGTEVQDVDQLMDCLKMKVPVLNCTLQLREEFEQEVKRTVGLSYVEDFTWPGLGVVRYVGSAETRQATSIGVSNSISLRAALVVFDLGGLWWM